MKVPGTHRFRRRKGVCGAQMVLDADLGDGGRVAFLMSDMNVDHDATRPDLNGDYREIHSGTPMTPEALGQKNMDKGPLRHRV